MIFSFFTLVNSHFPIKIFTKLPINKLGKGLFVFMYRATRIPPHLGIIFKGKLYDITLQDPNLGVDASEFLTSITKKFTKTIFFEIQQPKKSDEKNLIQHLNDAIMQFQKISETTSCISPLKFFFNEAYQLNTSQVNFIFDLIPLLIENQLIINTYHLNLERNINQNEFLLKTYTKEDIINCLQALNRKEVIC